jgi:hypothetical protein
VGGSECLVVFCPDLIERISANFVVPSPLALEIHDYYCTMVLIGVVSQKYLDVYIHVDSAVAHT